MKKKNLKSLKLNKRSISNLESNKVNGGTILTAFCWSLVLCPTINCPTGDCSSIDCYLVTKTLEL